MYRSTKTFPPISCAFRQWRAHSHCKFNHGYGIVIKLTFESAELDVTNWVVDFGALKSFRQTVETTFDHKTLVAHDDPNRDWFEEAHARGIADIVIVEHTGCEKFAELVGECAVIWLKDAGYGDRVRLVSCEVWEHAANSASWSPDA